MKLPSGLEVTLKSMSYDEALAHLEAEGQPAKKGGRAFHEFRMQTLEKLYGPEVAKKVKAANSDVVVLYRATIDATWPKEGKETEEKNS